MLDESLEMVSNASWKTQKAHRSSRVSQPLEKYGFLVTYEAF